MIINHINYIKFCNNYVKKAKVLKKNAVKHYCKVNIF